MMVMRSIAWQTDRPCHDRCICPRPIWSWPAGLGELWPDLLESHMAHGPIEFMPHCFDTSHFASSDPARAKKTAQIVMIGNRGTRRHLKFLYVPGGRRRARFARSLSEEFGSGFALYGHGWSHLAAARGPLPLFEQEAAIQSARISANWDHFDTIASYFSDRLPFSLAAGVPHVTSWHDGYDQIFADCPGLYACKTLEEAVDACRMLLARSDSELLEEGLAAKELGASPIWKPILSSNRRWTRQSPCMARGSAGRRRADG